MSHHFIGVAEFLSKMIFDGESTLCDLVSDVLFVMILLKNALIGLFCRLNLAEFPYCARLHIVKELMERNNVSIEEVISELG